MPLSNLIVRLSIPALFQFVNKFSAEQCAQRCREQCFFLTAAMKPVEVELFEKMNMFLLVLSVLSFVTLVIQREIGVI